MKGIDASDFNSGVCVCVCVYVKEEILFLRLHTHMTQSSGAIE